MAAPARERWQAALDVTAPTRTGGARLALRVAAAPLLLALALALAVWPVTVTVGVVVTGVLVLAWRAPAWALAAGLLLVGLEGSVKLLLLLEPTPLSGNWRAVGAAAIDLALFAAVAGILVADRLRTPRMLWDAASRAERLVLGALGAWLVLSVLQIAQGGDLVRGVEGFRLFQSYTLVAVAAAVVVARRPPVPVAGVLLAIAGIVAAYAAARVAIGPARAEIELAWSAQTTVMYGEATRGIGSFSSAVGLGSYLTPLAVLAVVAGLLVPRMRIAAWIAAALAVVAVVGSYGRGPVVAMAAGLVFAVLVVAAARDVPWRRKLAAAGLVVGALGLMYVAVLVASRAAPELGERAKGVLDPLGDASVQERLDNWNETLGEVVAHPIGQGVGAAGEASARDRAGLTTTDNSFLKVLVDQGLVVGPLFIAALLAAVVLLGRRLGRARGDERAVGLAALSGFVAFLVLATTGEYVEQPGKVVAWALLGTATALALRRRPDQVGG